MWSRRGKKRKREQEHSRAKGGELTRFQFLYGEVTPDAVKKTWIVELSERIRRPK
jgi:hypothetical protein